MRAVFLVLLTANLIFLAWAKWIDGPREEAAQDSLSRLPRLQLVTESPPGPKPTAATAPADAALAPATAEKVSLRIAQTCTSIGPFSDLARAARAAGLLTQRGFHLQQRAEEGETIEGYWVFVGGLQSDADVGQVVGRLEKSGFTDAHVMKNYSTNRRVSVGMFSTRERAEKRAAAIRKMGLQPEIGERTFPGTVYWVDVAPWTRASSSCRRSICSLTSATARLGCSLVRHHCLNRGRPRTSGTDPPGLFREPLLPTRQPQNEARNAHLGIVRDRSLTTVRFKLSVQRVKSLVEAL